MLASLYLRVKQTKMYSFITQYVLLWLYYVGGLVCVLDKDVTLFVLPTTILHLFLVSQWKPILVVITSLSALLPVLIIFCLLDKSGSQINKCK